MRTLMRHLDEMKESLLPKFNYSSKQKVQKNLRLPKDMAKDLQRIAESSNMTDTDVIMTILDKSIKHEVNLLDEAEAERERALE